MGIMMFLLMLMFSALGGLSSMSWFSIWVMMEISTFFFIPLLMDSWSVEKGMVGLKYYLIQSISSSVFLFAVLMIDDDSLYLVGELMIFGAMMIKLGVFPFHGWMLQICENLPMNKYLLLVSVQEVIPLIVISKVKWVKLGSLVVICASLFVVALIFSRLSVSWMIMSSSLFNMSWLMMGALMSNEALIFYLLVYFSLILGLFSLLDKISLVDLSNASGAKTSSKFFSSLLVFFIMGVPPFGVFLSKVEILEEIVGSGGVVVGGFVLLLASVMVLMYVKIVFSFIVSESVTGLKTKKWGFVFSLLIGVFTILPWGF